MHGNLARWLRLLGYDTLYSRHAGDNELIRTVQKENRILVTRDYALYQRCVRQNPGRFSSVFITADTLGGQIREVLISVCRDLPPASPLCGKPRCVSCNGLLHTVGRDELPDGVPGYVRVSHSIFRQCTTCRKVYWDGSHRTRIDETIKGLEEMMRKR